MWSAGPTGVPVLKGFAEQMFVGQDHHYLDEKGRLTIPAHLRDVLNVEGAYLMQGFEQNLMVLTSPSFEIISQRINKMSLTDPMARLLRRLIFSSAEKMLLDKAGRILIPEYLRKAADLVNGVYIVGVGAYLEIWSEELWSGQTTQLQDAQANGHRFAAMDISSI